MLKQKGKGLKKIITKILIPNCTAKAIGWAYKRKNFLRNKNRQLHCNKKKRK